jgi:hypothetical protein
MGRGIDAWDGEKEARMKQIVLATGIVLAYAVAAPFAQQAPAASNEPAHKVFVMSGCLERGSSSTDAFKLTGAVSIGQAPPADRSGGGAAARAPTTYELLPISSISEQGVNRETLESHVGNRAEVTVRPVEVAPGAPSSTTPAPSTAARTEAVPQRYTVVKISRLTGSC